MKKLIIIAIIILAPATIVFAYRGTLREYFVEAQHAVEVAKLPSAQPYVAAENPKSSAEGGSASGGEIRNPKQNQNSNVPKNVNAPKNTDTTTAVAVNLAVPFTSQAPFKVWDAFHEDACEEAAFLMVNRYYTGKAISGPQEADDELHKIMDWEETEHAYGLSITAEEAATVLRGFYGYKNVELVENPSVETLKNALRQKLPVIVPADGKMLENPNFRNGGPAYHMLVLKGFTTTGRWITNDPGTRLGANFTYREANIMESMHDWNGGDVANGRKVVIIVHPNK
jgi:hypothetical protein